MSPLALAFGADSVLGEPGFTRTEMLRLVIGQSVFGRAPFESRQKVRGALSRKASVRPMMDQSPPDVDSQAGEFGKRSGQQVSVNFPSLLMLARRLEGTQI